MRLRSRCARSPNTVRLASDSCLCYGPCHGTQAGCARGGFRAAVSGARRVHARYGRGCFPRGRRHHRGRARARRCGADRPLRALRPRRPDARDAEGRVSRDRRRVSERGSRGEERAVARRLADRCLSSAPGAAGRKLHRRQRRAAGLALDAASIGRALRTGRDGIVSELGADERDPGARGGRAAHRHGDAGDGGHDQSADARRGEARGHLGDLPRGRGAGRGRARLRDGDDRGGRQDRGARQRLCRGRQARGVRAGGDRFHRRAVGDPRGGGRRERSGVDRCRSAVAGRARSVLAVDTHHR